MAIASSGKNHIQDFVMLANRGVLLAFLASAAFSMKAVFVKLAYRYGVDAVLLLALRMAFSLPVLIAAAWWSGRSSAVPLTRKEVMKALRVAGKNHGPGTVAKALADLTAAGEFINSRDKRGYRLPTWPVVTRMRRPRTIDFVAAAPTNPITISIAESGAESTS